MAWAYVAYYISNLTVTLGQHTVCMRVVAPLALHVVQSVANHD